MAIFYRAGVGPTLTVSRSVMGSRSEWSPPIGGRGGRLFVLISRPHLSAFVIPLYCQVTEVRCKRIEYKYKYNLDINVDLNSINYFEFIRKYFFNAIIYK